MKGERDMNLISVTKPVPKIIWEVYDKVKLVLSQLESFDPEKDIVIGGGCLSNSYMDKPINDVDVFVQFSEEDRETYPTLFRNAFGPDVEMINIERGDSYSSVECPMLYRTEYEGTPVEIIFNTDIKRVYDFDIRMRQFYLMNNQVFASERAIEDIENKILALACPFTPIRTFVRMYQFKEELGFQFEKESMDVLLSLLGKRPFQNDYFERIIESRKSIHPKAKNELFTLIAPYKQWDTITFPKHPFPYHSSVEQLFSDLSGTGGIQRNIIGIGYGIVGKNYEKLKTFKPNKKERVDGFITIDWKRNEDALRLILEKIKPFILRDRTEMLFQSRSVSYYEKAPQNEILEKANLHIRALEEALSKKKNEIKTVLSDPDISKKEVGQWFHSIQRIFNENCSYYNPINHKNLSDGDYRQAYNQLFDLAYKDQTLDSFIEEFISEDSKYKSLLIDLLRSFLQENELDHYFSAFHNLFNESEMDISTTNQLRILSLEKQFDENNQLWDVSIGHMHFSYILQKEEVGYSYFKTESFHEDWINEFFFLLFKNEWKNFKKLEEKNNDEEPFFDLSPDLPF